MINFKKEDGSIIYFAVLVLGILFSAGTAVTVILVRQIGIVREMNFSVGAFYAADAGIEKTLYRWADDLEDEDIIEWGEYELPASVTEEHVQKYELRKDSNGMFRIISTGSYAPSEEFDAIQRGIQIQRPSF